MADIFTPEHLIALLTLALLEIVLGIDNIVFLSIVTAKLPPGQRSRGRRVGLALAMLMRIGLLLALSWITRLTTPLFALFDHDVSGRDLILFGGGLFLIAKATWEIHDKLEGAQHEPGGSAEASSLRGALVQIVLLDVVFSLDSVITAVGMTKELWVMITAVVLSVIVMMASANAVSEFVEKHPTIKMLALSFLILIGVLLVAEGLGKHVDKGYVYFAMAFSLFVEFLNIRIRKKSEPVRLRNASVADPDDRTGAPRDR